MKIKLIYLCFFVSFISGCAGVFATDDKLYDMYSSSVSDSNLTFFYSFSDTEVDVAIKNTGNAFINNLSVSFYCSRSGKVDTRIYSLGNLKPYFNKTLKVPFKIGMCDTLSVGYVFIPSKDGGFIDDIRSTDTFNGTLSNSIEGYVTIK